MAICVLRVIVNGAAGGQQQVAAVAVDQFSEGIFDGRPVIGDESPLAAHQFAEILQLPLVSAARGNLLALAHCVVDVFGQVDALELANVLTMGMEYVID